MKRLSIVVLLLCGLAYAAPVVDGPVHSGKEVAVDLPVNQRLKNIGGTDGAGQCVFTSITHGGRYQNVRELFGFQAQMAHERGGGYPEKVDAMLKKYAPGVKYMQYEGSDPTILELALKTGRMPCVTYNGHDPHYRSTISHMVNLVYLDANDACILDNNFIGDGELVWMTRGEFLQRWKGGQQGWAVILLSNPPVPVPHKVAMESRWPKYPDPKPQPFPIPYPVPTPEPKVDEHKNMVPVAALGVAAASLAVVVISSMRKHS
jgi:hypothetical protein